MSDGSSTSGSSDLRAVTDLTATDRVITLPVSPDEDALLRRLAQFERLGATLAPTMVLLKNDIRARDRRDTIREPGEQWMSA